MIARTTNQSEDRVTHTDNLRPLSLLLPLAALLAFGCQSYEEGERQEVERLLEQIRSSEGQVLWKAVWTLGDMNGLAATRGLVDLLSAEDPRVRRAAARELEGRPYTPRFGQPLGGAPLPVDGVRRIPSAMAPAIVSALDCDPPTGHLSLIRALANVDEPGPEVVRALSRALGDDYWGTRANAAWALGEVGAMHDEAIDRLVAAMGDNRREVRIQAAVALHRVAPSRRRLAEKALAGYLADERDEVRVPAIVHVGHLDGPAPWAVSILSELLDDTDLNVVAVAGPTLYRLHPASLDGIVRSLSRHASHPSEPVRANAINAIKDIGEAAVDAVPALIGALDDRYAFVRREAFAALSLYRTPEADDAINRYIDEQRRSGRQ